MLADNSVTLEVQGTCDLPLLIGPHFTSDRTISENCQVCGNDLKLFVHLHLTCHKLLCKFESFHI